MDRRRVLIMNVLASWLVPAALCARLVPVGTEFQVNTYTTSDQFSSQVGTDAAGNFVVVWSSPQDGSFTGVFGQRYASSGAALGTEFQINTHTTSVQRSPAVASDSTGSFVVVWNSY